MIAEPMTYWESTEIFLGQRRMNPDFNDGEGIASSYLSDVDESTLEECERLNVILPLLTWCAEKDILTQELKEELWLYYESYLNGTLDKEYEGYEDCMNDEGVIMADDKAAVFRDLKVAYVKAFGTEELVPAESV